MRCLHGSKEIIKDGLKEIWFCRICGKKFYSVDGHSELIEVIKDLRVKLKSSEDSRRKLAQELGLELHEY